MKKIKKIKKVDLAMSEKKWIAYLKRAIKRIEKALGIVIVCVTLWKT